MKLITSIVIIITMVLLITSASAATIYFNPSTVNLQIGQKTEVKLMVDSLPTGMSKFNIEYHTPVGKVFSNAHQDILWGTRSCSIQSDISNSYVKASAIDKTSITKPGAKNVQLVSFFVTKKTSTLKPIEFIGGNITDDNGNIVPITSTVLWY
jgi:hypothetical protein